MRKFVVGLSVAVMATCAFSADERTASRLVKKYSETIACQISDLKYDKNQYKAIKIIQGDEELLGFGDVFVVYWSGDVGCNGGNGTVTPNFTVVEHRGFISVPPVVAPEYKFPDLDLAYLRAISGKNGVIKISGVTYGPNDQQHFPTKKVSYTLKIDQEKNRFIKQ